MDLHFVNDLLWKFGLPAIFLLTMAEGDITLLLAGVLAHGQAFGDYSFLQVFIVGTLAGVASDNAAYALGRAGRHRVKHYRFYCAARARIERLTDKFGPLSIFVSKFTYGLRWGACAFYGVAKMPYLRFLVLSFASCSVWVAALAGVGFVFHSAVYNLVGDFKRFPVILLVVLAVGVAAFYLAEKYWLSKKVEEANPETIQKFELAAEGKFQEIREEISEILPHPLARHKDAPKQKSKAEGD
ncbi:MAG TPA: DedA family protein [Pyrinomonadaceae bacterium]|jgi:membrane protein DedA with SNARE-associated domain|nr:DedA family protein [Pyrinomonadaceae bacterium]